MNNLVEKCIKSIIRLDKSFNPDCEDENVVSSSLSHLGLGILAGIYDAYWNGYISNNGVFDKTEYTKDEMDLFNELAHNCINEIIELDKKLYPNNNDSEPVVSIDALAIPLTRTLELAYNLGEKCTKAKL